MIDHHGVEWLRVPEAAERFGIRPSLLYGWVKRGTVESRAVPVMFVRVPDVALAERAWRTRKKGWRRHAAA